MKKYINEKDIDLEKNCVFCIVKAQPSFHCECPYETIYNGALDECERIETPSTIYPPIKPIETFSCGSNSQSLELMGNLGRIHLEQECGVARWDKISKYWKWEENSNVIMECLTPKYVTFVSYEIHLYIGTSY